MGHFYSVAGMLRYLTYMIYDFVKKILRTLLGNVGGFGITYPVFLRCNRLLFIKIFKKIICSGDRIILIKRSYCDIIGYINIFLSSKILAACKRSVWN